MNKSQYKIFLALKNAGYKKILILGCPGSGKTIFSKIISVPLGLPLFRLDDLYWGIAWKRPIEEDFIKTLENTLLLNEWIIDGNYYRYLPQRLAHAEAVVFLDIKTTVCLWRAFKRFIARRLGEKSTLPINISKSNGYQFQWSIALKLINNIINFSKNTKPQMLALVEKYGVPIYIIKKV